MRRITTNYIGYWSLGFRPPIINATVIDRRDYRKLLRVRKAGHRLATIRPSQYGTKQHHAAVYFLQCALDALNKRSTKP